MNPRLAARETVFRTARPFAPHVSVHADEDWITLTARPQSGPAAWSPWEGLLVGATLAGPVKLALAPRGFAVEARAEILLEDGVDVSARVQRACTCLCRLASGEARIPCASCGTDDPPEIPALSDCAVDIPSLAAEAGWSFVLRSSGRVAIDLAVPGQFHVAIVEPRGSGCRVRAPLAVAVSASARARSALGVFLLTVAGLVRLVRAGSVEDAGETTVFVETDVPDCPTAAELHDALSALAVACRMAGRETKALLDERTAIAYLAARGRAAHV
jgi:hypothetical protein